MDKKMIARLVTLAYLAGLDSRSEDQKEELNELAELVAFLMKQL